MVSGRRRLSNREPNVIRPIDRISNTERISTSASEIRYCCTVVRVSISWVVLLKASIRLLIPLEEK
jgi:hypothetical protein